MVSHYQNDSATGEYLKLCADIEHDAEGGWWIVVGGEKLVKCDSKEAAQELIAA